MEQPGDWVLDELNKRVVRRVAHRKIAFRPSDRQYGNNGQACRDRVKYPYFRPTI
jgi:hypothetical protein